MRSIAKSVARAFFTVTSFGSQSFKFHEGSTRTSSSPLFPHMWHLGRCEVAFCHDLFVPCTFSLWNRYSHIVSCLRSTVWVSTSSMLNNLKHRGIPKSVILKCSPYSNVSFTCDLFERQKSLFYFFNCLSFFPAILPEIFLFSKMPLYSFSKCIMISN